MENVLEGVAVLYGMTHHPIVLAVVRVSNIFYFVRSLNLWEFKFATLFKEIESSVDAVILDGVILDM